MIRFIINFIFVVGFLILSLPLMLITWIIGLFNPHLKGEISLAVVGWAFKMVEIIAGAKVTVIGAENVPKDRPVLYISNHRSYYDIILTYCRVPRQTGYIAKDVMAKIPIFSIWMSFLHCMFLDRKDIKKGMQTIKDAIELINNGISVHVCPEGTRNKTEEIMIPFHDGTFKIAERTGCTIIPITVNNTDALYEKNKKWHIHSAHVIIEYGKPIETADMTKEERRKLSAMTREVIMETYLRNQALV